MSTHTKAIAALAHRSSFEREPADFTLAASLSYLAFGLLVIAAAIWRFAS